MKYENVFCIFLHKVDNEPENGENDYVEELSSLEDSEGEDGDEDFDTDWSSLEESASDSQTDDTEDDIKGGSRNTVK